MDRYGDMLLRTACLLLKDRQEAEEAVQDAFIQAYRKIGQLQEPARLKYWLIRIVVNRCRMKQRTWSFRSIFPAGGASDLPVDESVSQHGADELFMTQWRNGRLTDAVRCLDYTYREAIVLFYFHEMSIREIADQLDTSESNIKSRLFRGRAALRKMWEQEETM